VRWRTKVVDQGRMVMKNKDSLGASVGWEDTGKDPSRRTADVGWGGKGFVKGEGFLICKGCTGHTKKKSKYRSRRAAAGLGSERIKNEESVKEKNP